jgi:hypothetical protein
MTESQKKKSILTRPIRWPWPLNRIFGFLFSKKMVRLCLFSAACLITLIIAFYTVENIRAKIAWSKHVKELEAKGISVDFKDYIPPEIPDDENLAKIPMFTALEYERKPVVKQRYPWDPGDIKWKDESFGILPSLSVYFRKVRNYDILDDKGDIQEVVQQYGTRLTYGTDEAYGNWIEGKSFYFPVFQIYYRGTNAVDIDLSHSPHKALLQDPEMINVWERKDTVFPFPKVPASPAIDVEYALKKFDPVWLELIQASNQRPEFRFPLEYEELYGCLLPHLSYIKGVHQYGKLRASAELHAGHHQEGTDSICLMLQLVDKLESEAFLISYLVRIADLQLTIHPLWEGITHHLFDENDLQKIFGQLADMTFIPQLKHAYGMERAVHVAEIERVSKHRSYFERISNSTGKDDTNGLGPWTFKTYIHLVPKGWITRNVLSFSNNLTKLEEALKSWEAGNTKAYEQFKQSYERSLKEPVTVYNALRKHLEFSHINSLSKALRAEATVIIAKTAVALERYYLNQSAYPESLSELVPHFLPEAPIDPIDLQPLRYQKMPNHQFIIYSIGANEKDDEGKNHKDNDKGDWVWRWPVE